MKRRITDSKKYKIFSVVTEIFIYIIILMAGYVMGLKHYTGYDILNCAVKNITSTLGPAHREK